MDADYWKGRCLAAERALARARGGLPMTAQRRAVLELLADLKTGAQVDTNAIAGRLDWPGHNAYSTLTKLEALGLVEREPGRRGIGGCPALWRLGHLVQVEACE